MRKLRVREESELGWGKGAIDGTGGVLRTLQFLPPSSLHSCDNGHSAYPDTPDITILGLRRMHKASGWLTGVGRKRVPVHHCLFTPCSAVAMVLGRGNIGLQHPFLISQ